MEAYEDPPRPHRREGKLTSAGGGREAGSIWRDAVRRGGRGGRYLIYRPPHASRTTDGSDLCGRDWPSPRPRAMAALDRACAPVRLLRRRRRARHRRRHLLQVPAVAVAGGDGPARLPDVPRRGRLPPAEAGLPEFVFLLAQEVLHPAVEANRCVLRTDAAPQQDGEAALLVSEIQEQGKFLAAFAASIMKMGAIAACSPWKRAPH
ncbi:hypothetical protein ACP70R_004863 [Stipagrostis hirtigluma subsp. patula]